ncbi:MAG: hypothetical protein J2O48_07695 [Solirubrobacterales bacterium]|nr:hypothetical protein [Solirubrobacterales bacterium]
MREHEATRRLVKSHPELWQVCSDPAALAKHLGAFGEITITRLEPESTVAWEGDSASGTVQIEPAGWGTRVKVTAQLFDTGPVPEIELVETPDPLPMADGAPASSKPDGPLFELEPTMEHRALGYDVELVPEVDWEQPPVELAPKPSLWQRIRARFRRQPLPFEDEQPEPPAEALQAMEAKPEEIVVSAAAEPEPEPAVDVPAALDAALDSLGQAHHRPYSRA